MELDNIKCPYCKNDITVKPNNISKNIIKCPKCDGILYISDLKKAKPIEDVNLNEIKNHNKTKNEEYLLSKNHLIETKYFKIYQHEIISKLIGIIIIALGLYLLIALFYQNPKIGMALILIGISFFFLISETKKNHEKSIIYKLIKSERITIMFSIWIFISLLISNNLDFRLFLIIVIIGFLVLKEISTSIITQELNKRMKIFVISFLVVYFMLVIEKVASFLSR